jgi:phosphate transport system permease protein
MTRDQWDQIVERWQAAIFGVVATAFVVAGSGGFWVLLWGSWPLWRQPGGWTNLLGTHWDPLASRYGLAPFVAGSVVVALLALVVSVPLSLGVAVISQRLLPGRWRPLLTQGLTVFATIPSVVFGWWGLQTVVPAIRRLFDVPGFSLLAAGLVLGLMMLPTLAVLFGHALGSVPNLWVEASYALGATEDQTLIFLIGRYVWPQLMRAVLVGLTRAMGETMAVQMVIGGQSAWPVHLLAPGATLTTQILTDVGVFPPGTLGAAALDVMALTLLVMMVVVIWWSERWNRRA